jgi:MoaA/NifB/PqqE/SkfB family radical SAM enzyme
MIAYEDIKEVHLEISSLCNAKCPQCPRNFNGYTFNDGYPETYMTLSQAKEIFDSSFLRQLRKVLINGNFGDIVMNPEAADIVEYFRSVNRGMHIIISTNGGARDKEFWERLAKANTKVLFCLDGLEDTHHLYRQNTRYNTVIKNAMTFIGAGGNATWKCIKFKHNEHQIEEMRQLAKDFGFSGFELIDHGRDIGPVYNEQQELTHVLGDYNGPTDWQTVFVEMRSEQRTLDNTASRFNPESDNIEISCDTLDNSRIYIAANGDVAPCCFTGFYPKTFGKNQYMEVVNSQLGPMMQDHNAMQHGIKKAIEWFQPINKSWDKRSYKDGRMFVCDEFCGRCNNES